MLLSATGRGRKAAGSGALREPVHEGSQPEHRSVISLYRPGFHITGCPGQPFVPVRQPKVDPWLPDRATKRYVICLYIYVVGQPKCSVGQP